MSRLYTKRVARNKDTGFPILDKEEILIDRSLAIAISAGAVFTAVFAAWRQQRGKRK